MHTTSVDNIHFQHNGDFSGPVAFAAPDVDGVERDAAVPFGVLASAALSDDDVPTVTVRGNGRSFIDPYTDETFQVPLPRATLRELVATRVRDERIGALEQAEADALFDDAAGREVARWAATETTWD